MYGVQRDQCKKSKDEIFNKLLTCCICNLVPVPLIRDKLMINKVYCTKCSILNNITSTRLSNEDKYYLEQLVIECKRFCGEIFTYNTIDDLIEHENECDYSAHQLLPKNTCKICQKQLKGNNHDCLLNTNKRITSIESLMNDNFQTLNEKSQEKFTNLENKQETMDNKIEKLYEMFQELNIKNKENVKKTQEIELMLKDQNHSVKEPIIKLNSSDSRNYSKIDELSENIKLIMESNERKIYQTINNIENEIKKIVHSKFSELEQSFDQLKSIVSIIQSDSIKLKDNLIKYPDEIPEKVNDIYSKIQFIQRNLRLENFEDKILIDEDILKNEVVKHDSDKEYDIKKLEYNLNKLNSLKKNLPEKYDGLIDSDSLVEMFKPLNIEGLKLIQNPLIFKNRLEKINNNIENYKSNKILCGNISNIIENAHGGMIYDMIVKIQNNHLISCASDFSIKIWDLNNNTILKVIEKAHTGKSIFTLLLSSLNNKDLLLSGGSDSYIRFWDNNYNEIDFIYNGSSVNHMIQSNNIIIVGDYNKLINFYEINSKLLINKIKTDHSDFIWKILHLKSSDILLSGSADSTIKVWNIRNYSIKGCLIDNEPKYTIEGNTGRTWSLIQLKYDNNIIVSSDQDGTITFHYINNDNESNYKLINTYRISDYDGNPGQSSHSMFVYELFEHKMLVSLTSNSTLLFWNLINYEIMRSIKIKNKIITLIGLENDEGFVFTKSHGVGTDIIIWK